MQEYTWVCMGVCIIIEYIHSIFYFVGPGTPVITLLSVTPDNISFVWSVPEGSVVEEYRIAYNGNSNSSEIGGYELITDGSTNYTISGLQRYGSLEYHITVTANSTIGPASEATLNVYTPESSSDIGAGTQDCHRGKVETEVVIGSTVGAFVTGLIIGTIIVTILFLCTCHKRK